MCVLTVEEAVVFEAASAEQRVERVQALLALHGASVRSVDVRGAFWGQRAGQLLLRQLLVPETHTQKIKASYSHELKERSSLRQTYTQQGFFILSNEPSLCFA